MIWNRQGPNPGWKKHNARYHRSSKGGGNWEFFDLPQQWRITYGDLTFNLKPFNFKHTGLFPEQACNWDWFAKLIKEANRPVKVLNLFAYTGGATLAAAAAGASVTHVDASKGMGSTPHAHAVAKVAHPGDQGCVAIVSVFIDTFLILTMTALVVLTSGTVTRDGSLTGTALSQAAYSTVFGNFGNVFIAICLLFFAFSTIIGWYFFAEQNIKYLFGTKAVKPFAFIVCACIILFSTLRVELVWSMSMA